MAYGLVGLKIHAKTAMIVREEPDGIRRYCHIGTGNYNPRTATLYEDLGLLTANPDVGADLASLFNQLTGYGRGARYRRLIVAPEQLRQRIVEMIQAEIATATSFNYTDTDTHTDTPDTVGTHCAAADTPNTDNTSTETVGTHCAAADTPNTDNTSTETAAKAARARILMKMNALVDPDMIQHLYKASQAGVEIDLIVRSQCCLRPGVPGLSEHIRVRSIIGRYLEHSRIYHFANGNGPGQPATYIGSADLMTRNLDRRVEALVRIHNEQHVARIHELLQIYIRDDKLAWTLNGDGVWARQSRSSSSSSADDSHNLLQMKAEARVDGRALP